jgi:hypothetical protein
MFFRRNKKPDLTMIDTRSKIAMKMTCLATCSGDVKRANELYSFLADGIGEIPDFTPPQPTTLQQFQQAAGGLFNWVKENQSDLMQAWGYIQQIRSGAFVPTATAASEIAASIPPLPD